MGNEFESYLSRSLKNWAARNQPPPHGNEGLLRAVVSSRWRSVTTKQGVISTLPPKEFDSTHYAVYLPGILMRGSFTLSLAWPVHIGTLVTLAQ